MTVQKLKTHNSRRIYSFPPIEDTSAKTLILGSMPGKASLEAQQYYAHPRNRFWQILGELLGTEASRSYEERVYTLKQSHIAVWDVLQSCTRSSSLDSDIRHAVPNDFKGFFATHPHITHIFFNGTKAESCICALSYESLVFVRSLINDTKYYLGDYPFNV